MRRWRPGPEGCSVLESLTPQPEPWTWYVYRMLAGRHSLPSLCVVPSHPTATQECRCLAGRPLSQARESPEAAGGVRSPAASSFLISGEGWEGGSERAVTQERPRSKST